MRGAIRTHCLDVRFLEAYGRLLDQLGDRTEAGKFLFLSGVRGPDVDPAIALVLARHAKAPLRHLVSWLALFWGQLFSFFWSLAMFIGLGQMVRWIL